MFDLRFIGSQEQFTRLRARLQRIAAGILRNDADAEDVVQQALLAVTTSANLPQYENPEAVLITTARRLALNERKRQKYRLEFAERQVDDAYVVDTPEEVLSAQVQLDLYRSLAAGLSKLHCDVFDSHLEGNVSEVTAELLDLNPRTARRKLADVLTLIMETEHGLT